jgi:hypothetical protein
VPGTITPSSRAQSTWCLAPFSLSQRTKWPRTGQNSVPGTQETGAWHQVFGAWHQFGLRNHQHNIALLDTPFRRNSLEAPKTKTADSINVTYNMKARRELEKPPNSHRLASNAPTILADSTTFPVEDFVHAALLPNIYHRQTVPPPDRPTAGVAQRRTIAGATRFPVCVGLNKECSWCEAFPTRLLPDTFISRKSDCQTQRPLKETRPALCKQSKEKLDYSTVNASREYPVHTFSVLSIPSQN